MLEKKTVFKITKLIDQSERILLALHLSPDGDSFGSVLAMNNFLQDQEKKVFIVSGSEILPCFKSLPGIEKIKIKDFCSLDFSDFDLFISLDCGQPSMISRKAFPEFFPPGFKIINIDHHLSNTRFGDINLIDAKASSTTEILYHFFDQIHWPLNDSLAQLLFLGIFSDTGCFQYPNCSVQAMKIAAELREKGADLDKTVLEQFRSYSFKNLKYWGMVLANMELDKSGLFVWSKTSLKEREAANLGPLDMEAAANLFCPVTDQTEFGIILDEQKGFVKASLRSRQGFDVSKIAVEFGGGGHKLASGFILKMSLKQAEKVILEKVREFIKGGV